MFSGNAWEPQLTINTNVGYTVNSEVNKIRFQLKFADIAELRSSMKIGSKSVLGGGSWGYGGGDLGIYFSGTDVSGIGVTQVDLFNVFDANITALSNGETVTVTLPVSGEFSDTSVITSFHIMVSHGDSAAVFSGKQISISDLEFLTENINDLNGDGSVNSVDIMMLKGLIFDVAVDIPNRNNGDINGDGEINILDYLLLKKAILGIS